MPDDSYAGRSVHVHRGREQHIAKDGNRTLCGYGWVATNVAPPATEAPMCRACFEKSCTCTAEGGCDEEGTPGCAFCRSLDGEEPCPAEAAAELTRQAEELGLGYSQEEARPSSIGDDTVLFVTRPNSAVVETHIPDCAGWNFDFMPCRGQCIEKEFA